MRDTYDDHDTRLGRRVLRTCVKPVSREIP